MSEILPSAFYRGTRQSNILPSTALGKIKHSAKVALPSARHSAKPGSRQIWALPSAAALGKRWPARDGGHLPSDFAECLTDGTRQIFFIFKNLFCRVPAPGHMWRCLGFWHPTSQLARNILNFLPQPPHAITRCLDKFCDF